MVCSTSIYYIEYSVEHCAANSVFDSRRPSRPFGWRREQRLLYVQAALDCLTKIGRALGSVHDSTTFSLRGSVFRKEQGGATVPICSCLCNNLLFLFSAGRSGISARPAS